jgi:hypothetical protein
MRADRRGYQFLDRVRFCAQVGRDQGRNPLPAN